MSGIAALKGFRTQFVYSLFHILKQSAVPSTFRLEGIEDIDVFDEKENLDCVIQIKNLGRPLIVSDILSNEGTSFVRRFLNIIKTSPNTTAFLVSFGEIGPELQSVLEHKSITSKDKDIIRKYKLAEDDWKSFKVRVTLVAVNEECVLQTILDDLKEHFLHIDPTTTADILMQWLSVCAEKQVAITSRSVFDKVESIAIYLSERIAATAQLGKYINPLNKTQLADDGNSRLQDEFYNGVSARYEHILNELDVGRPSLIREIRDQFNSQNVVVLHGASGQGKSALAYRFIFEQTARELAYEINLQEDPEASREAIMTIAGMAKNLKVPVLILINVSPNSLSWLKIVGACAHLPEIRFLITIRQEDWFKANAAGVLFLHQTVEVTFQKSEAGEIYKRLNEKIVDLKYADFEEAWLLFGGAGPLLEFVYVVTQGASLKQRLQQQVSSLHKEEGDYPQITEVLRMVCLADAFGARLEVSQLRSFDHLFEIAGRLEKEFLLKISSDKKLITGFHPLRSRLLLECLFDEVVLEKQQYVLRLLSLIEPEDTYVLLLNIFHEEIISPEHLLSQLKGMAVSGWVKCHSVVKALLWAGIRKYIDDNLAVFQDSYRQFKGGWYIMVNISFGDILDHEALLSNLEFGEEISLAAKEINRRLSPKDSVFDYAVQYINNAVLPEQSPATGNDWRAYGGLLFWERQFKLSNQIPVYAPEIYEQGFLLSDTAQLADLMLGMHSYGEPLAAYRQRYAPIFIEKFRRSYQLPELTVSEEEINVKYIVDIAQEGSAFNLNDRSVTIAELLRRAFPDTQLFSVQGLGHHLDILPLGFDDSKKSMPLKNLFLEEWTTMNYTLRTLFDYRYLPKDWKAFFDQLRSWEHDVAGKIKEFNKCMEQFFQSGGNFQLLLPVIAHADYSYADELKNPQTISDPLALFDKTVAIKTNKQKLDLNPAGAIRQEERAAKLQVKYKEFNTALSSYKSHLENFIKQSATAIYNRAMLKLKNTAEPEDNPGRISQYNLYQALHDHHDYAANKLSYFSKYFDTAASPLLYNEILHAALLWRSFLTGTYEKKNNSISSRQIDQLKQDILTRLSKSFKAASKGENYEISIQMDERTSQKPVIFLDADTTVIALNGINKVYSIVKEAIGAADLSLKKLTLDLFYDPFYIVSTVQGNTVNDGWYVIPLYVFENKELHELNHFHLMPKPIDELVAKNRNLVDWTTLIPKAIDLRSGLGALLQVSVFVQHLKDIAELENEGMDELRSSILQNHFNKTAQSISASFQSVLDTLSVILADIGYDMELYSVDEYEKEYIDCFIAIKDHLYPENDSGAESQTLQLKLSETPAWSERLKVCYNKMSLIYFLALQKYVDRYNLEQTKLTAVVDAGKEIQGIQDFFKLQFSAIPDAGFKKEATEINVAGSKVVNYTRKLDYLECGLFDRVNLKVFSGGDYNAIFEGHIEDHQTAAVLKWFVDRLVDLYGADDLATGRFTTNESLDVIAGRLWSGRMWLKSEGKPKHLPGIMISGDRNRLGFTIFLPNASSMN